MNRTTLCALAAAIPLAALAACSDQPLPTGAGGAAIPRPSANVVALGVTDLGTLGGGNSFGRSVNRLGQVVGQSDVATPLTFHAFLWSAGVMYDLGTLGGTNSTAADVNNAGDVVGVAQTASGDDRAFLWHNGIMTDLGTLGGSSSQAMAINDKGQVVGLSATAAGPNHAFLWQNGSMEDLGTLGGDLSVALDINNAGWIVGLAEPASPGGERAVAWHDGVIQELSPSGPTSRALSINELGQVVGSFGGAALPFIWEKGVTTALGAPPFATQSPATGINDLGQIVVAAELPSGGVAYTIVDGVFEPLGTLGGARSDAKRINDVGQVAGTSTGADGFYHATLWTIPIAPAIDVAPGDAANKIKLSAKGQIAVAILTNPYFDATRVNPGSLALGNDDGNDTPVARDRKLVPVVIRKDVDRDGDMDVVATFDQQAMVQRGDLTASSAKLVLTGALNDGKKIRSAQAVTVTP